MKHNWKIAKYKHRQDIATKQEATLATEKVFDFGLIKKRKNKGNERGKCISLASKKLKAIYFGSTISNED